MQFASARRVEIFHEVQKSDFYVVLFCFLIGFSNRNREWHLILLMIYVLLLLFIGSSPLDCSLACGDQIICFADIILFAIHEIEKESVVAPMNIDLL